MCHGYIDRREFARETKERVQGVRTPAPEPVEHRPGVMARLRAWLARGSDDKRAVPAE